MPSPRFTRPLAVVAAVVVLACGCLADAGPAVAANGGEAGLPMTVLPNRHAFVPATIRGLVGSVRIEPDADVSVLLNMTRERLGLGIKDGMTILPAFRLDGAQTAETVVALPTPDQQERWLQERPDLLAVIGMDVLRQQPLRFDPVRGRFGWGDGVRRSDSDAVVVPMQAKVDQVPVVAAAIDGHPVRLRVAPWSTGLALNGEADTARRLMGTAGFQRQKRWGRYGWAMTTGDHAVAIGGRSLGTAPVDVLAPYVADSEDDQELPFIAEGWDGQLAPGALAAWDIVIDYPRRQVRLLRR